MDKLKLSFFLILAALVLSNPLSAGPVYASKWIHPVTKQCVVLYGDDHGTHERVGKGTELALFKQFQLKIKNNSDSLLFLFEGYGFFDDRLSQADSILSDLYGKEDFTFLGNITKWIKTLGVGKHLIKGSIRSVDFRNQIIFESFTQLFGTSEEAPQYRSFELFKSFYKENNKTLVSVFQDSIDRLSFLIKKTKKFKGFLQNIQYEDKSVSVFQQKIKELKAILEWRKDILIEYFSETLKGMLNVPIHLLNQHEEWNGVRDELIAVLNQQAVLYDPEIVDYEILFNILMAPADKKIIVLSGFMHIEGVEEGLNAFGFTQVKSHGKKGYDYIQRLNQLKFLGLRELFGTMCNQFWMCPHSYGFLIAFDQHRREELFLKYPNLFQKEVFESADSLVSEECFEWMIE